MIRTESVQVFQRQGHVAFVRWNTAIIAKSDGTGYATFPK